MNTNVVKNQSKVVVSFLYLPAALLLMIVLWLWSQNALSIIGYTEIQKEVFLYINHQLGQYPSLMINLTQFGNALVFLSCLSIFIIYAPKLWEALISASLVSLLFSKGLKIYFQCQGQLQCLMLILSSLLAKNLRDIVVCHRDILLLFLRYLQC